MLEQVHDEHTPQGPVFGSNAELAEADAAAAMFSAAFAEPSWLTHILLCDIFTWPFAWSSHLATPAASHVASSKGRDQCCLKHFLDDACTPDLLSLGAGHSCLARLSHTSAVDPDGAAYSAMTRPLPLPQSSLGALASRVVSSPGSSFSTASLYFCRRAPKHSWMSIHDS